MKEFLIVFSLFAIITFLGAVGTFYNYFKNKEQ